MKKITIKSFHMKQQEWVYYNGTLDTSTGQITTIEEFDIGVNKNISMSLEDTILTTEVGCNMNKLYIPMETVELLYSKPIKLMGWNFYFEKIDSNYNCEHLKFYLSELSKKDKYAIITVIPNNEKFGYGDNYKFPLTIKNNKLHCTKLNLHKLIEIIKNYEMPNIETLEKIIKDYITKTNFIPVSKRLNTNIDILKSSLSKSQILKLDEILLLLK